MSFEHYRPASVHRERKQKIRGPHWSRKTAEVGLRRHGWVTLPQAISRIATRRSTRRKERRAPLPFFFFSARLPTKIALFGYSEPGGGGGAAPGRGKDHPEGRQGSRQRRRKREQKGRVKICICLSIKTSDSSAAEFSMMPERR